MLVGLSFFLGTSQEVAAFTRLSAMVAVARPAVLRAGGLELSIETDSMEKKL